MTKQEYKLIRDLAWDLIIEANVTELPIDIIKISRLYNLEHTVKNTMTLYDNMLSVSSKILNEFGLSNSDAPKYLTVRVMSPMIVLRELGVKSADEVKQFTGLPIEIATQRFDRLQMLVKRGAFETSRLETIILTQFRQWIESK